MIDAVAAQMSQAVGNHIKCMDHIERITNALNVFQCPGCKQPASDWIGCSVLNCSKCDTNFCPICPINHGRGTAKGPLQAGEIQFNSGQAHYHAEACIAENIHKGNRYPEGMDSSSQHLSGVCKHSSRQFVS